MKISFNTLPVSMKARQDRQHSYQSEKEIQNLLEPFSVNKAAKIPPLSIMKGINPNNNDVFDSFNKIDDAARSINFVKSQNEWDNCLLEEIEEFNVARLEYEINPSSQNYDHMEEEMGDIFYTAASIAKDSNIDPKEAFKATNRKFFNRINLMERLFRTEDDTAKSLKDCEDYQRRALWNAAKRKIYDAQALKYRQS